MLGCCVEASTSGWDFWMLGWDAKLLGWNIRILGWYANVLMLEEVS